MTFEVISNKKSWDEGYSLFKPVNIDVYFSYDYCKLHELDGKGRVEALFFNGDNGMILFYPFLIKEIKGYNFDSRYYDIESVYGYGGPVVEGYNQSDMDEFEINFEDYCNTNNIVAEFIRFHPVLSNQIYFERGMKIERNRDTVIVDLDGNLENRWNFSISSKNRNMIRKATKSGIEVLISNDLKTFKKLYKETMTKLNAEDYYYFCDDYFTQLYKMDKNQVLLEAKLDGITIASAFFIFSDCYINYHLAGSDIRYLKYAPNNLLLFEAIKYGIENKKKKLFLGGGTTSRPDDSLLKYKKSFSPLVAGFFIGKKIHNKILYDELISQWEFKNKKKAKLFLQYEY